MCIYRAFKRVLETGEPPDPPGGPSRRISADGADPKQSAPEKGEGDVYPYIVLHRPILTRAFRYITYRARKRDFSASQDRSFCTRFISLGF